MPTGPKGEKRPRDPNQFVKLIVGISTGEVDDAVPDDGKDKAAQSLGRKGGAARAASAKTPRNPRSAYGGERYR